MRHAIDKLSGTIYKRHTNSEELAVPDEFTPESHKDLDQRLKEVFSRNLYQAMIKKGWTQSELGRRSGLERYNISNYVRGNVLPLDTSLEKLAEALGVEPGDLMPDPGNLAPPTAMPSSLTMLGDGKMRVRVDAVVSVATGTKIMQMIDDDTRKVANGR